MTDVHSKETRSYNMSRIRSKDTKPEMLVRRCLYKNGFRYRLHVKGLPGQPDIVLPKYNTVIFIHGCFWHGHQGCKYFKMPKTHSEWWANKINRNISNDYNAQVSLTKYGWRIITIWECNLRKKTEEGSLNNLPSLIKESADKKLLTYSEKVRF